MNMVAVAMLLAGLFAGTLASTAAQGTVGSTARPERPPNYKHFMFGVFIDSTEEILTVPLTKVFSDFLTHGIEFACIGQRNYYPLAREKGLNAFAKANGVHFICNLFLPAPYDGSYSDDQLRRLIKEQVGAVNALPDSDVVVGWRIGDEIESTYHDEGGAALEELKATKETRDQLQLKRARAQRNFQRLSALIRELDPTRRVIVNHCQMPDDQWMDLHEDEAMSSTGVTGIYNSYRVRNQLANARRLGFGNYILVNIAMMCPPKTEDLRWYGYREPVNQAVLNSRSIAQHMQDYTEIAYTEGAAGICYFIYWAGGANYEPYTLTGADGGDYQGKWEAVRKAAGNIRQWEGAPSCAIISPPRQTWVTAPFRLSVMAGASAEDPVAKVTADYSLDGARSWTPLPEVRTPPYNFSLDGGMLKTTPCTVLVRARAINTHGPSLWDVVELRVKQRIIL